MYLNPSDEQSIHTLNSLSPLRNLANWQQQQQQKSKKRTKKKNNKSLLATSSSQKEFTSFVSYFLTAGISFLGGKKITFL